MSCLGCQLPKIDSELCPIHYQKKYKLKCSHNNLTNWIRYRCSDDEVNYRNAALNLIYGRIPSYCLFVDESDFVEEDWVDWWLAVCNDIDINK